MNRLVLARACALVGALVAGGYLGYALSWVGVDTELGDAAGLALGRRGARRRCDRHHVAAPRARVSRPIRPGRVLTCWYGFPPGSSRRAQEQAPAAQHPADRRRRPRGARRCGRRRRGPQRFAAPGHPRRRPGCRPRSDRHPDHPHRAGRQPGATPPATARSRPRPTATSPSGAPPRTPRSPTPCSERMSTQEGTITELEDGADRGAGARRRGDPQAQRGGPPGRRRRARRPRRRDPARAEPGRGRGARGRGVVLVAELEQELDVVRAELQTVTSAWHAAEAIAAQARLSSLPTFPGVPAGDAGGRGT